MDIPQKIEAILNERKKLLVPIKNTIERLEHARRSVEALEMFRSVQDNGIPPELLEKLETISTKPFYEAYDSAMKQLEHLQRRFSREEINISFVGRAGQGKSLVLQRISGLEGDIIPSADGSDCTGARSIISNRPGAETSAEITFYTESEYVKIVNRYLKEITKTDKYHVTSISEISHIDMGRLQAGVDYTQVMETSLFEHLEKYVTHAPELQGQLGKKVMISKGEIESYVAQYNSKNKAEKYYTYLGVKGANIISSFPCAQCGKIVLVDTIGTGATSLGVEEDMLETVREDSDAIILMMRPDPLRGRPASEDYRLVEKISREVSPEYAKQMLFWLVNRVESGKACNTESIPEIMAQLKKKELPVARYLDVDCWQQEEVENKLLLPVLEQMSANLASIDRMILSRANEQLTDLERAYHMISSRVERALGASINQDERREFYSRITATISSTTNNLRDLYYEWDKKKGLPCATLKEAAAVKLKHVLTNVPSKEEVLGLLNNGTIHQFNALDELSTRLRLDIINDFLDLNHALHEIVLDVKRAVIHILADPDKGRLSYVVSTDPDDPETWLKALRGKLDEVQFAQICSALEPLESFDLRMENFLIYKVRCCLSPIDWSIYKKPPELKNGLNEKDALAAEIDSHLRYFLEDVHQNIENELADFYIFPNTAIFAVLRDFYDRVACARNKEGTSVLTQWQYLYEDKIPMIWAQEHKNYAAAAGRADEWRVLTEDINVCAADGYFLIVIEGETV